ncbi:MAG: polyprenyl synthetase family protein [bacterium JZ-2024 1]
MASSPQALLTLPRPDLFSGISQHLSSIQSALHDILEYSTGLWFQEVLDYMLTQQGKMLRGLLGTYAAIGDAESPPPHTYQIAALSELLHIASLLHDDVLDEATTRRSSTSVNFRWSDKVAILVGDYILTRIFSCLSEIRRWDVLAEFISAARALSEGSLLEFHNRYNLRLLEDDYFAIITRKTSALFSCALVSARLISEGSQDSVHALRKYGIHLGIAFQVTDDLLDYRGDIAVIGKSPLKDLRQGYVTLPFIRAFSDQTLRRELEARKPESPSAWSDFVAQNEAWLVSTICRADNLSSVSRVASYHRDQALQALSHIPEGVLRDRLAAIAQWVVSRDR